MGGLLVAWQVAVPLRLAAAAYLVTRRPEPERFMTCPQIAPDVFTGFVAIVALRPAGRQLDSVAMLLLPAVSLALIVQSEAATVVVDVDTSNITHVLNPCVRHSVPAPTMPRERRCWAHRSAMAANGLR